MTTLYGIKNCDTVKKARKWLEQQAVDYNFHDVRADGLSKKQLQQWAKVVGWETLVNKRSTTWKQLPEATRDGLTEKTAITTLLEHPTLIKRPVLEHSNDVHVGFQADNYSAIFK